MRSKIKIWLKAARLRTLPLATGAILLGSFLAAYEYAFSWSVFVLTLLTAVLLQVLSNFANDYGDFQKGTDQAAQRADRALSSGMLKPDDMKKGMLITGVLAFGTGIGLLILSFGKVSPGFIIFLVLGLLAIAAAIKYTTGKNAYGYKGLGDLFVLLFFGPVAVGGTFYLMTGQLPSNLWIPSTGFGLLCAAVLNINNLRDIESDKSSGKYTLAVRLGFKKGVGYQYALVFLALLLFALFARVTVTAYDHFAVVLFGILYYLITDGLSRNQGKPEVFNRALKKVSLLNLLFTVVLGILWLV